MKHQHCDICTATGDGTMGARLITYAEAPSVERRLLMWPGGHSVHREPGSAAIGAFSQLAARLTGSAGIQRLESPLGTKAKTIFRSPTEGKPSSGDRIIWSRDSERFVIIGRRFRVPPQAKLPRGAALYLLYDRKSGRLWCNASRASRRYQAFGLKQLSDRSWRRNIPGMPDSHDN